MSTGGPTVTTYTPPAGLRAIISGAGGVREHLAETLRAQGVRRPMILCGRNVGATPLVQVVAAAPAWIAPSSRARRNIPQYLRSIQAVTQRAIAGRTR
jgi:hypothetical protein